METYFSKNLCQLFTNTVGVKNNRRNYIKPFWIFYKL